MKSRLLNTLTALSLLLGAATIALWALSYRTAIYAGYAHVPAAEGPVDVMRLDLAAGKGNAWVGLVRAQSVHDASLVVGRPGFYLDFNWRAPDVSTIADQRFLGFGNKHLRPGGPYAEDGVSFPLWLPVLLCALLPSLHAYRAVRNRRRFASGACPSCGYDLRATPGQCPECGAVPSAAPTG